MIQHAGILIALRGTLIRSLFLACILLAGGVTPSRAQGDVDEHTLLLLRFENSLAGAQGETPTQSSGVTFESGISGQGALVDGSDLLRYATAGNFNLPAGTIEFWVKPRWGEFDSQHRVFFSLGFGPPNNDFVLLKDGASNFRFMIGGDDSEAHQGYSFANWAANQWHHIAVTWTVPGRMITYIDGVERINHPSNSQDKITPLPADFNLGSRSLINADQANCVIDELRVSNVARTQQEIRSRLFAVLTVNSISINVPTRNLWKTWRVKTEVAAGTNLGIFNFPPAPSRGSVQTRTWRWSTRPAR